MEKNKQNLSGDSLHPSLFRQARTLLPKICLCGLLLVPTAQAVYANNSQLTNLQKEQKDVLKGRVVDQNGEGVIGATVKCVAENKGVVTDVEGNFTLNIDKPCTLEVSFIGYKTIKVDAVPGKPLTIKIAEDSETLDEVVVVGYSTVKKESLTGALQTVSGKKLKDVTSPSVSNMLNSKVSGVYVSPGSGQPGANAAIVIRGKSTINGSTAPLWVIDGVIVGTSPGTLNPADVENMTVLKDAASTAIYGSQGANGVIVVTTKNPAADKLSVSFDSKVGITRLSRGNLKVMNGQQLYDYYASFANQDKIKFPRWNPELRKSNFDWWDFATQTGTIQEYNVNVQGGTERLRSMLSLGIYDEKGAVKGYDYKKYNLLVKNDYRPFEWLTIKPQVTASLTKVLDKQHSVTAMYANLPWDSPYDDKGNIVGHRSPLWVNSNSTNYLYDLQWDYGRSAYYALGGNFDFDIRINKYLTFSSVNNVRQFFYESKSYTDPRSSSGEGINGSVGEYRSTTTRLYTNQLLRYNQLIGKHSLNAVVAYEFNDYSDNDVDASGVGLMSGYAILGITAKPEKTKGYIREWAVQSLLSNLNYAYDNRYLAQLSLRRDGASNFGDKAKYGNFFSISGGWNIHNEKFFKIEAVDQLKLRLAYGSVGNRPSALYPQYDLYAISAASSYNGVPGALISQIGNRNMTWEKTYTLGLGLDLGLWNRVRMTLDFYDKDTKDLLYSVPVTGLTGVTSSWRNVGSVRNIGFEGSLSVDAIKQKDMQWTLSGNIGLNRNKVTQLYGQIDPKTGQVPPQIIGSGINIAGSAHRILRVGADADTWYMPEWAGVNKDNGAPQWYKTVTDANGKISREITQNYSEADQVETGAYTPKFFGGLSTDFSWKSLTCSMSFGFSVGGKIYNYSRSEYDSDGAYSDRNQMCLMPGWKRWEKPGDIATHPVASYNNSSNSNKVSSRYLEDGSYFKMRSLSVGYNMSLPQYHLSNLRLFISGENLFTCTKYSGVDPEIPSSDGQVVGVTSAVYPSTKKIMFGLNVTF